MQHQGKIQFQCRYDARETQYISPPHVDVPEAKKIEVNAANSVTRILSQF